MVALAALGIFGAALFFGDRVITPAKLPGCSSSRWRYCPRRAEPVNAVCDRRATASVELPGKRTREDDID
jgi:hypothetical protein